MPGVVLAVMRMLAMMLVAAVAAVVLAVAMATVTFGRSSHRRQAQADRGDGGGACDDDLTGEHCSLHPVCL